MSDVWPPTWTTERFGKHIVVETGHDYLLIDRQKISMIISHKEEDKYLSELGQGIPPGLRWLIYPKDSYETEVAYKDLFVARAEFNRLEIAKEQNEGITEDDYSR